MSQDEELNINWTMSNGGSVILQNRAAGPIIDQYPATIFSVNFKQNKVLVPSVADIFFSKRNNKQTVAVELVTLDETGRPKMEETLKDELIEQSKRAFLNLPYLAEEDVPEYVIGLARKAQSLLLPVYIELGLPVMNGITYCPLLEEAQKGNSVDNYLTEKGELRLLGPQKTIKKCILFTLFFFYRKKNKKNIKKYVMIKKIKEVFL